jgi:hypothetical protein
MKMDDEILNLPISTRCYYALYRNDIQNLAELTKMSKHDLLNLPTFGKKCLEEIVEALGEIGLSLSPGPEDKKQWEELGERVNKQVKGFLAMKEDTTPIDPTWMQKTGGFARDMTLRDYYAGLAMQGMYTSKSFPTGVMADTAIEAYQMADVMLKAREAK